MAPNMASSIKDQIGFWGKPTSTLDWCEENYVVSHYIAEFWNTVSNMALILPPIFAMFYFYKFHQVETRYHIAWAVTLLLCSMGGSASQLTEQRVVIIGAGYAGIAVANKLRGKCHMTLIDPKECLHHCVGSLRAVVEPGYAEKIFIPLEPAFGDSFKRGFVTNIDVTGKRVTLNDGEEIQYDYLIIATGSTGPFPSKLEGNFADVPEAVKMYQQMRDRIKQAKEIVIIGGGPVGVELSGEIGTDLPDKKVTLIHSKPTLIDGPFSDNFRQQNHDQLVKLGVDVLLGQRVINLDDIPSDGSQRCTVKTDKGQDITADLVIVCTGMKTNSEAYAKTLGGKMDDRGCLKVDDFLRVDGFTDVYAIGDCSSADDQAKMAYKADIHAGIVAKNIDNDANGKPPVKYNPPGAVIIVPIGRHGGVMQYGSWVLGSFFARTLKSKDLFTSRFWGDMRQKVPSSL